MAPLTPHWQQPSHGEIQQVVVGKEGYTSKSFSRVTVAPFGLFAKMSFPPCTRVPVPTYATVQMGRDAHLSLNSDLVYINHSCEPSLIFDMPTLSILAGPHGLLPGTELTFFYPSTEWSMAQPFDCFCATPSCKGRIAGAAAMAPAQLRGMWLNGYIRDMLEERERDRDRDMSRGPTDPAAAKNPPDEGLLNGDVAEHAWNGTAARPAARVVEGPPARTGPTSRELSGEMGGDTTASL